MDLATTQQQTTRPFRRWSERASVKHGTMPPETHQLDGHWAPPSLHRYAQHPRVIQQGPEIQRVLLGLAQIESLKATERLEDYYVTPVAREIAHEMSGFELPREVTADAGLVMVDESSHSQRARGIRRLIEADIGPLVAKPRFLPFQQYASRSGMAGTSERSLCQLACVCVSETLITGGLTVTAQDPQVDSLVRAYYEEHRLDESIHHAFFGALIGMIWPQLSKSEKTFFGTELMPTAIRLYLCPDLFAVVHDLTAVGFTLDEAEQIATETYDEEAVRQAVIKSASPVVRYMTKAGMLEQPGVRKALLAAELIEGPA